MKLTEREAIAFIDAHGFATTEEIAERFDVTPMTVRRTLAKLEELRLVVRVRSGAIPTSSVTTLGRHLYKHREEKKRIAAHAMTLLDGVATIFLDAGSTCYLFAELIPDNHEINVITQSLDAAAVLRRKSGVRVISPGGELDKKLNVLAGSHCEESLREFKADVAILGTGAVDTDFGTHERELVQIPIKRIMNQNARDSYLLLDSSKLGQTSNFRSIPIAEVGHIITTDFADADVIAQMRAEGVEVTVVKMSPSPQSR